MNTLRSFLLDLRKGGLMAAVLVMMAGSVSAQSAQQPEMTKAKQKPVKTNPNNLHSTGNKPAPAPARMIPDQQKEATSAKVDQNDPSVKQAQAKEAKMKAMKQEHLNQEAKEKSSSVSTPPAQASLKSTSELNQQAVSSREEQVALKKQRYAESLRSRGFPEAEISKMVNSKFPENKGASSK